MAKRHIRNKTGSPLKGSGSVLTLERILWLLRPEQPVGGVNGTHFSPRTISYIGDNKGRNICGKAHCYPAKTGYGCPALSAETDECRSPDLYLLRDAAADEAGRDRRLRLARPKLAWMRFSWMLPKDEMEHYAERCSLFRDPVRPKCSEEALDVLVMKRPMASRNGLPPKKQEAADVGPPGKKICPPFKHHQGHTR